MSSSRRAIPDYDDAAGVYVGRERQFDLSPPPPGSNIYLRVRAIAGALHSAWSHGILVSVAGHDRWLLSDPTTYSPQTLLDIHLAALRMCAARGDLLAVLAMPEHYRTADAITHAASLQAAGGLAPGSGQDPMFGFGALYHPWLYCADPTDPTHVPPHAARRPRRRGGGRCVPPPRGRGSRRPTNRFRTSSRSTSRCGTPITSGWPAHRSTSCAPPPGASCASPPTPCPRTRTVRPINVRRLLALLRRTAERYGTAHVFEPNSDLTRRTARRTFQSLLGFLFSAGAFAGATAAEAFQVSTPVTADDLDKDVLIVELRVAPSQPLAFLTVLLVQAATGTVQVVTA